VKQITEHLEAYLGQSLQLLSRAEESVLLLQERRAALISAAVTGKIDVRNYSSQEASAVCQ
jgi:type I restriction enzyme S subunit